MIKKKDKSSSFILVGVYVAPTLKVIWWLSSFTGGGRPQVSHHALFLARAGTWVEPRTYRKLAGILPYMKKSKVPGGIRTHSGERQVIILSQRL